MKIAIPTEGKGGLDDSAAEHFGRCETYTILDGKGEVLEVMKNTSEHMGGKGMPPEIIRDTGAEILICKGMGPRALGMCRQYKITVYVCEEKTARDMFDKWKAGQLSPANDNDVCEEHRE